MTEPLRVTAGGCPQVPGFTMLRCVGSGSYGEVWLARDTHDVFRAVKIVYRDHFEHDRPYEREFRGIQRFEPVSRTHASQLAIIHIGRNDEAGFFYYAMELADDVAIQPGSEQGADSERPLAVETYHPRTIKTEIQRLQRVPVAECLRIGISLATALEHLHRHGLVHRDIKPSNVIFVGGIPKLADIGLVTDQGMTVSYVGTEGFVPPEGPGTPSADLYGLGKVLYEMATGLDRMEFPDLPASLEDPVEQARLMELNLVLLKACEGDPTRRYPNVGSLLADLALLNSGGSIRRARQLAQRWKLIQRAGITFAVVAVLLFGAYASWQRHREAEWKEQQNQSRERERIYRNAAEEKNAQLIALHLEKAAQLGEQGDPAGAALWLAAAADLETSDTGKANLALSWSNTVGRAVWPQQRWALARPLAQLAFDESASQWVALDAAGQLIRFGLQDPPVAMPRNVIRMPIRGSALDPSWGKWVFIESDGAWSVSINSFLRRPHSKEDRYSAIAMDQQGRWFLAGTQNGRLEAFPQSQVEGGPRWSHSFGATITAVAVSPEGESFAAGLANGSISLGNMDGSELRNLPIASPEPVAQLSISADSSKLLAVVGRDVWIWRIGEVHLPPFVFRAPALVKQALFSGEGDGVVVTFAEGGATWVDAAHRSEVGSRFHSGVEITSAELSPDGRMVVLVSAERVDLLEIHPSGGLKPRARLEGGASCAHFSADGRWLALGRPPYRVDIVDPWGTDSSLLAQSTLSHWKNHAAALAGRQWNHGTLVRLNESEDAIAWKHWTEFLQTTEKPAASAYRWHQAHALALQREGAIFASRFHWSRCLQLQPDNKEPRVQLDQLMSSNRFRVPLAIEDPARVARLQIPARSPQTPLQAIDLTRFYNAALQRPWLPTALASNDWSRFGPGEHRIDGLLFDVRGVIQLSSSMMEQMGGNFPRSVRLIPIGKRVRRLDFLHATAWDAAPLSVVGKYRIHYRDGEIQEVLLTYGENIREWWASGETTRTMTGAAVAWQGGNPASDAQGRVIRLYQMGWRNPKPDKEVESLDFESAMGKAAPFLLGITAREP